ncbi:WbqC family protein [bacterium]|jgi:hypothetical protein|nr:WbqC family protein [bacterium]
MQPYFFPYVGYFQLINESDIFVLYDQVTYRKNAWMNRNRIKDKGTCEPIFITVPIQKKSSFSLIKDISISNQVDWRGKIKNLLFFNYKKASFFDEVFNVVEELLFNDNISLHEYNSYIIRELAKKIGITTPIISSNSRHQALEENLLNTIKDPQKVKEQRVFDLCKLYNSDCYLNPINGMDLYSFERFEENNLKIKFIKTTEFQYFQFKEPFQPHLSIIDLLMHKGFKGTFEVLQNRVIIEQ